MEHLHMLTVLVRNKSGVLQRITGLFSRRGYSIQTIYAEQTKNPAVSRIIMEVPGNDFILEQVEKQLTKLVDVLSVNRVTGEALTPGEGQAVLSYKDKHAVSEITLLDSTLREGAQGEGILFTTADRLNIIKALDKLGIPLIEVGRPGSDPEDAAFFAEAKKLPLRQAQLVVHGSVRAPGNTAAEDAGLAALLRADTKVVCLAGSAWRQQVTGLLHITPEENLAMIRDSIAYLTAQGKTVLFDAEHYFDGCKADADYAEAVLKTAEDAGASCIILCDSNGGCFPDEIYNITAKAAEILNVRLGVHCRNDIGCAAANAMMAVKAGAAHIQGTFTGFGERCGSTCLATVIGSLQGKQKLHCIPQENLRQLTSTALYISDLANLSLDRNAPYIGRNAFAHKGGLHTDAAGEAVWFEHIEPAAVGNKRSVLLSAMNGREAFLEKIAALLPDITLDDAEEERLFRLLRQRETEGYQYEAASASLELLLLRKLERIEPFFLLDDFKVIGEKTGEDHTNPSTAVVKACVNGRTEMMAGEGEGPVHALDVALRKAVGRFYPAVDEMRLADYKVRMTEPKDATAAKVRVLIVSTDGDTSWTTVGVSRDIVRASLKALADAVEYKLLKDKRAEEAE